jgi:MATE family multidrug resistance protein
VGTAVTLLVCAAVFQLSDGIQIINTTALRSIPDVKIPALITFIAYWGIALPGGYILGIRLGLGGVGIWGCLALGLTFAAAFLGRRFHAMTSDWSSRAGPS